MVTHALGSSIPFRAPLFASPPCRYTRSEFQLVTMAADPDAVRALVPEPLEPNSEGLLVLMINRLEADVFGRYREAAVLVPSTFEKTMGSFTAFMYLDADRPLAAGREVWGWPKKLATLEIEGDATIRSTITRGDAALIESTVELDADLGPEDLAFDPTFFNLKLIPSVVEGAPPEVMQITATTLQDIAITRARGGRGTVTLRSTEQDPLGPLSPREVLGAAAVEMDVTLGHGTVLHDYLRA